MNCPLLVLPRMSLQKMAYILCCTVACWDGYSFWKTDTLYTRKMGFDAMDIRTFFAPRPPPTVWVCRYCKRESLKLFYAIQHERRCRLQH